ncbi:hypothetical protein HanHA300_Chr01g0009191 [Helianthus annuus]|nr:hypothetical protein HanHA300_Chr01g0009191 [Helianthus annuus]KAJ0626166.1 hypothetical protein HanHA89_Chr01g0009981 [Helianthus annuus]KAJ0782499.1 hypothetical protein HanLR1_Chr01g0008931 [Helianthus annuus]
MDCAIKTIYGLDWIVGVFVNNINFITWTRLIKGKKVFTPLYQNAILMNKTPLRTKTHRYINKNIPDIKTYPPESETPYFLLYTIHLTNAKIPKTSNTTTQKTPYFLLYTIHLGKRQNTQTSKIPKKSTVLSDILFPQ